MKSALFKIPVFLLTVVVSLTVAYLTLSSDPLSGVEIPLFYGADKIVHVLMFFGVGGCLRFDAGRVGLFKNYRFLSSICFLISVVYGGLIEIMQSEMVNGRSGDFYDLMADAVGALLGVSTAYIVFFKKRCR